MGDKVELTKDQVAAIKDYHEMATEKLNKAINPTTPPEFVACYIRGAMHYRTMELHVLNIAEGIAL